MGNKKLQFSNEQLIGQASLLGSLKGTKTLDTFAGWILAGFGTALTFIIANVTPIDFNKLKSALIIFIVATVFCAIQKYLAIIVICVFESSEEVNKRISSLVEKNPNIFDTFSWEKYFKEIERPYWPISKQIIRFFNKKLIDGDLNAGARLFIHCFQTQSILVVIEIVLLIICAWQLITIINP